VPRLRTGRFLTRTRELPLHLNLQNRSGSHPRSTAFPGVRRPRRAPGRSPLLVPRLRMSGATPLLPHLPSWGTHSRLCLYMILHSRAPLDNKTRTGRVDGLHRRGSEHELPVFETGRKWWGCEQVLCSGDLIVTCVSLDKWSLTIQCHTPSCAVYSGRMKPAKPWPLPPTTVLPSPLLPSFPLLPCCHHYRHQALLSWCQPLEAQATRSGARSLHF
jgi:hypothetical protein